MSRFPSGVSKIMWGSDLLNELFVGYPLDDVLTGRKERAGSSHDEFAGLWESWITGRDYTLRCTVRWLPHGDTTYPVQANSWSGGTGVQAFLDWARDGNAFRFIPDVTAPLFYIDSCYLVEPMDGEGDLEMDTSRSLPLTIMNPTVDFDQALRGVLFEYAPGGSLTDPLVATCTRVGAALYLDKTGTYQSAGANVLRDAHYLGGVRTTLLEGQRTNSALGSCSFGDYTYWAYHSAGGWTLSSAPSIIAGQTATRHLNNTDSMNSRSQAVGVFVNGQSDCGWWIVENDATVPSVTSVIGIYDSTTVNWVVQATFTWATHAIAITAGSGTCGALNLGNGRYLLWVVGTGTASGLGGAGNTRRLYCYPTGTDANTNAAIIHHAQFEANASCPTTPIVTVAATATRYADYLHFPYLELPQPLTVYMRFIELGTAYCPNYSRLWQIGKSDGSAPCLGLLNLKSPPQYYLSYSNATETDAMLSGTNPLIGDLVEMRGSLNAAGSAQLGGALNGGVESYAGFSAARGIAAAWSDTHLALGGMNAGQGAVALIAFRIATGTRLIPEMREL